MTDKIVLITGATDGIGKQTAYELAGKDAFVIIHGRNETKVDTAIKEIRGLLPGAKLGKAVCDLSSFEDTAKMAESIQAEYPVIDVLLNNAGIYMNNFELNSSGIEMTFAVNHFSHYVLTMKLVSSLRLSREPRIINVSSIAHQRASLDISRINDVDSFSAYTAYANSKLANVLFTYYLAGQLYQDNFSVNCLHPGVISTKLLLTGFKMTGGTLAEGAATSVYLASDPDAGKFNGKYFIKRKEANSSKISLNKELQSALANYSDQVLAEYL
ncbi:MAG: SDR family oxidoreductase [Ignavibacteriales bacterium]|nr:SDR family oxidoreductase [Ignavibacteriales bacterium]MCF8307127.1 SDR family oxidoreductase [Ignavibacteriales bacterium]MCF8316717.1 SDR family oxidoreductase [Ignavibacteriales bacterium]MCF8436049.1 SDR family oxidoreductase [Ignavibacteriales bacterium]